MFFVLLDNLPNRLLTSRHLLKPKNRFNLRRKAEIPEKHKNYSNSLHIRWFFQQIHHRLHRRRVMDVWRKCSSINTTSDISIFNGFSDFNRFADNRSAPKSEAAVKPDLGKWNQLESESLLLRFLPYYCLFLAFFCSQLFSVWRWWDVEVRFK
jgi:hypothetical protein